MPELAIPEDIHQQVLKIGASDIVVGIPSFNNCETIGPVVNSVRLGLQNHFPSARGIIVNSDGGSEDGTADIAAAAASPTDGFLRASHPMYPVEKLSVPYNGVPGKGSALKLIFELARELGAKACAVVDPALRSTDPDWTRALVEPVYTQSYDFVAPCYQRRKFDGALNNGVVYPLIRALYGRRVRFPIGGEFGVSSVFLKHLLNQDVWETDVARSGIDVWMMTQAASCGFRTGQAFLGSRAHDTSRDPSTDLSVVLGQVLGAVFGEMERSAAAWQRVRGSEAVTTFGDPQWLNVESVQVDTAPMQDSFLLGFKNLFEIWGLVMPPATLLELKKITRNAGSALRFPDPVWVRTVYDFAVAYHSRVLNRDHLLRALTPLYLGWVASFIIEMQEAPNERVERRVEELCLVYEVEKPYLISRWRWPDRFNP